MGRLETTLDSGPLSASLKRNFSWALLGNIIYALCQWGVLLLLVRMSSSTAVGQFALGLAITAPIITLTNLSLRVVQVTDVQQEYRFSHYFNTRAVTTLIGLLIVLIVTGFSSYPSETVIVVLVVGLSKGFDAIGDIFYGLFQRHEQLDFIAKSQVLNGVLSLVGVMVGLMMSGRIAWAAGGFAGASVITLFAYTIPQAIALVEHSSPLGRVSRKRLWRRISEVRKRWSLTTTRHLLWIALPVGLASALASLNGNVPRYLVEHYLGASSLGVYAALAYVVTAANTFCNALAQTALPRLSRYYADGNRAAFGGLLLRLEAITAALAAVGLVLGLLAGRRVVSILYGTEYAAYFAVVLWLLGATALAALGWFLDSAASAARRFRPKLAVQTVSIGVAVVGSVTFIPIYGLVGAAVVTFAAMGVQLILKFLLIVQIMRGMSVRAMG